MARYRYFLLSFLKFGALSGLGWLCDLAILFCLVRFFSVSPLYANILSSLCAALFVFIVSRRLVFTAAGGRITSRLGFYLLYTFTIILIASFALQFVVVLLRTAATANRLSEAYIAGIAKILITPPQLCLNFLVARFLIERQSLKKV